ncbi:MAG: DMT family transporter [Candidatus Babeliaceae bacterium]|nr:DMT family transporter [Candidatus Babeliaceae bacterium]
MERLLILLMNAFFAATFPIGKIALRYSGPVFLTAVRMLLAGSLLLIYTYFKKDKKITVYKKDWWIFTKTSFFYIFLAFVPEFWALNYLTSIKTNLLWSVQPFLAAILGFLLLSEKLNYKKLLALGIGFIGMLPIIFHSDQGELGMTQLYAISLPELALFIAVFSTIYAWFLIKQLLEKGYSLSLINGITMSMGGLLCLLTSFGENILFHQELCNNFGAVFGYSLLLVLISNVLAYGIYGYLLSRYSITFLSFTGFTCPLFGFLFSYLMGETIPLSYIYGCGLIIIGLYVYYREE